LEVLGYRVSGLHRKAGLFWALKWWMAAVLTLVFLPQLIPLVYTRLLTEVAIMALFAMSLNLQLGYGGLYSMGHAAFFGTAAYTFGLLTLKCSFYMPVAAISGILMAGVMGAIIGFLCVRLGTTYFVMLTLAFGMIVYTIIYKWYSLTGGENGIVGLVKPDHFSTPVNFYYLVLTLILICLILMRVLVNSPFGKVIQGIRENKERMEFLGINIQKFQLIIFVIGALFAGVAGILYSLLNHGAFPGYAGIGKSTEVIIMCLIGGMGTFIGPAIGALVLVGVGKVASDYMHYWPTLLGVILILCSVAFRGGLCGAMQKKLNKMMLRRS
jgi:branched-chain amino acid transport system permease protein